MTREEAKKIAEAMMAYAEGKNMEFSRWGAEDWRPCDNPSFQCNIYRYRVQPEPKYRPFKNAEECWQEMQKHQPFGWITLQCGQKSGSKASIIKLTDNCFYFVGDGSGICHNLYNYEFDKHFWLFADGTPFGIKEE